MPFSFNATELDLPRLLTDWPKAVPIITDFITPDLFARGEQIQSFVINYPVPCGSGEEADNPR